MTIDVDPHPRVTDEPDWRDADRVFMNRADAGRALVRLLEPWRGPDTVVVGVPAGGALVAVVVARQLGCPLHLYPALPDLHDATVIVVDDALATGATALDASRRARDAGATTVVVAVPVGSIAGAERVADEVDQVVVASLRGHVPFGAGAAYRVFDDPSPTDVAAAVQTHRDEPTHPGPTNAAIADLLDEVARLLQAQGGDPYRVRGWSRGAETVREHPIPVGAVLDRQGRAGLIALPHVGEGLAGAIEEVVRTGRLTTLDRLRGRTAPEDRLAVLPGVGEKLAHGIHDQLGVETLDELAEALEDGRLGEVPGMGPHRLAQVRRAVQHRRPLPVDGPPVALLLDLDAEYRERAAADDLPRIAPSRHNPTGEAWLPVLHATRDGWHVTALFSNTARAHALQRTDDWVVLYLERDDAELQATVVTETSGALRGRRVVRGREDECARHYGLPHG
jgi:predicted phosphoribosyltransferase